MSIVKRSDSPHSGVARATVCDSLIHRDLLDPVSDFVGRSGKQIRKSIVELAFAMVRGEGVVPLCLSESIEWLHAGSLVIDDIQDSSRMRRDKPSLHMQIGTPLALNAGNWMYFQAMQVLFDGSLRPRLQSRLMRQVVRVASQCHLGQALDLGTRIDEIDPTDIRIVVAKISSLKTGSLVSLSAALGAIAAGADRASVISIRHFGMRIGIALQMRNDLEELKSITRASSEFRVARTEDLENARITWPWAWAKSQCSKDEFSDLLRLLQQVLHQGKGMSSFSQLAAQLLSHSEALGEVQIRHMINRGLEELSPLEIDESALARLKKVLDRISNAPVASEDRTNDLCPE